MMRSFIKILLLFVFTLITLAAFPQDPTNEQLAIQYYRNGEFDKAVVLFQELFENNRKSVYYYSYYIDCLFQMKEYSQAENILKKLSKKNSDIPEYTVDLGYLYALTGNEKKKKSTNEAVLKNIIPDEDYITRVANAFVIRGENELAVETYLRGRKVFKTDNIFSFPLAELYQKLSRHEDMIIEYLRIINNDPTELEPVEDRLQDFVMKDENYVKVREILINQVQKYNYEPSFIRLLSWLFIQKKDFESAFVQLKSLDKRFVQNNVNLIQLADVCISNQDYVVASNIYNYILEKGISTPYYMQAKYGLLDVDYLKLINAQNPDIQEFQNLDKAYSEYLQGNFYQYMDLTEKILLRLPEIRAVYLHKVPDAIYLLNQYINLPQVSEITRAKMKLAMGDYHVLLGDVWEATLLYSQVDYSFKNSPIGYEAKFRNARLAFYMGDFQYASDLLDILKASTSELIANDALQLALVIQDNIGSDSNEIPLRMYARADFYNFKNQFDSAEVLLDTLLAQYPAHSLTDDALFAKGDIEYKRKNFIKALDYFKRVYTDYGKDILADDALFRAAVIYDKNLNQPDKASELYEKIILDYPDSVFVVEARKKFREIRGS